MSAHTPGPWITVERHVNYAGWVILHETPNGRRRVDNDKDGTFSEANARLIAAAPALLDVAEAIVTAIEGHMMAWPSHVEKHMLDGARVAVAQAKGEMS